METITHRVTPKDLIPLRNKIRLMNSNNFDIEIYFVGDRIIVGNDYLAENGSCLCFITLLELVNYFFN